MATKTLRGVVIDDDPAYRELLARAARGAGLDLDCFDSLVAVGSAEGFEDNAYDIALVDLDVEQEGSVEIAQLLASLFGKVPLLLMSPTVRESAQRRAWPRSVKDIVPKDIDAGALLGRAREVVAPG